jgi:hypothetical protein
MTDKELLELAAKAAGMQIVGEVDEMICQPDHTTGGFVIRNDRGGDSCWNPLTDDGDALRLAVKLQLKIEHYSLTSDGFDRVGAGHGNAPIKYENDPYAAARRAITRAAAEIGKTLKK